jgi:DNA-binding LytR/AlgR family response regulator
VLQVPATAELARALVVFVSAIQDAMNYRSNPQALQGAIWLLLGQIALTDENLAELMELMSVYRLDTVYTLAPI